MSVPFNWSRFVVRININSSLQKLYDAWATRTGIEHWFLRLSEYKSADGKLRKDEEQVAPGDNYKWLWHGYPDDTAEYGTIEEANGKDFMKFSFGNAGICSVRIFRDKDENFVELTQENIPDDDLGRSQWHIGCKTGWVFYLANMKSVFEGGIDLRNKNEMIQGVINA